MKTTKELKFYASTVMGVLAFLISNSTLAQETGIKRTDLQRHDLSIDGTEAVQARIDFEPHTAFGKHAHPGEEIIYVLEGQLPVTLKAGEVLFIPAGKIHSAKNKGNAKASELATYVVEKGKPILVMKH